MAQDFGTLGRLVVALEANVAQFERDLNKAEYQMQQFGQRIDSIAAGAASALKGMAAAAAAAFTFDAVVSGIEKAIDAAAELERMSQKAGVSAEALSGLKSVAKLSGTAIEEVVGSLQKLSKSMIEAEAGGTKQAATFKALGVSMADLKAMSPDEVMLRIAKSLDQVESGSQRVAAAQILFGKAGANLLPMLHDLAEKGEIVGKVTDQQAAMAERYERSLLALEGRKKSLYNTLAQALLPTMIDMVDAFAKADSMVGRLDKTAKGLAADNSLQSWARSAAMGVAFVVDVFDSLARVISIVGKAVAAAAADVTSFVSGFSGLGLTFKQGGLDAVKAQINGAFAEIKSHGEQFDKDLEDILNKPFMRDKLGAEFAARDAGQKAIEPARRNLAVDLPGAIGKDASAFENFLQELQRQATKIEQGLIPELTLKAQQLAGKEGKDPHRADAGIAAVQKAEEKRFLDDYQRTLDRQVKAEEFRLQLVGKTAHEQELLNIQNKADMDLQQKIEEETRKLGPLTEDTQARMAAASQQAADKMIDAANRRYEAERRWQTGVETALKSYIENATNAAAQANKLFTDAFKGMEDALVKFVRTGKLDFKSLADSIIDNMIRIQIQERVTAPLAKAASGVLDSIGSSAGSWLGNFFGGFMADGGPLDQGKWYVAGEHGPEPIWGGGAGAFATGYGNGATSGGDTYYIDARGADQAAVSRLEAAIRNINATFKNRTVGIVRQAFTQRAIASPI